MIDIALGARGYEQDRVAGIHHRGEPGRGRQVPRHHEVRGGDVARHHLHVGPIHLHGGLHGWPVGIVGNPDGGGDGVEELEQVGKGLRARGPARGHRSHRSAGRPRLHAPEQRLPGVPLDEVLGLRGIGGDNDALGRVGEVLHQGRQDGVLRPRLGLRQQEHAELVSLEGGTFDEFEDCGWRGNEEVEAAAPEFTQRARGRQDGLDPEAPALARGVGVSSPFGDGRRGHHQEAPYPISQATDEGFDDRARRRR